MGTLTYRIRLIAWTTDYRRGWHGTQSYYRLLGVSDNICRMDTPLCVNCAGLCVMRQPFISHFPTGREDFYLQYMVDGEMDILLDGKLGILRPGEAVLHFPHTEYWYAMRGEQPVAYYWAHFTGSLAETLVEKCRFANQKPLNVGVHGSIGRSLRKRISRFHRKRRLL